MSGFRTAARPDSPPARLGPIGASASSLADDVLTRLEVAPDAGLSTAEAQARLIRDGPNVVATHHARPLLVLWHQVCTGLGLPAGRVLDGTGLDRMDDRQLAGQIEPTTVFARVTPEQTARIVTVGKASGRAVAYLGDGVNDALALHAADVGISVDTAADVAKDAADVILLEKSLNVLADGITEGRRIFTNTMKYVLMGTSSNSGNMFSAAGASMSLPFLPMLPSQILLDNLLHDAGQLTIPTDHVDPDQQRRPSHWDIGFIRRFMPVFGPLSSLFDVATFAVMLWVFHSGPEQFRTGWFVGSLATQVLIIFVIRTRRVPFFRSRPSLPLTLSSIGVVLVGIVLPRTPLATPLGFTPLPTGFFAALIAMIATYVVLVDVVKRVFYAHQPRAVPPGPRSEEHPAHRRASRFSTATRRPLPRRKRRVGAS
ncbi:MAG TPA: HAD-IC family P-type ATPase [Microlunatus sp.]|nr:HAD-IC family P-type ATPase [Microlunatus sp.]